MNQLMNDKAVCWTAPATPGLFKIYIDCVLTVLLTKIVLGKLTRHFPIVQCHSIQAFKHKLFSGEREDKIIWHILTHLQKLEKSNL